jgi:hypothetical protein
LPSDQGPRHARFHGREIVARIGVVGTSAAHPVKDGGRARRFAARRYGEAQDQHPFNVCGVNREKDPALNLRQPPASRPKMLDRGLQVLRSEVWRLVRAVHFGCSSQTAVFWH